MKFTDGRWLLRPGVQAFHPVEVLDVETGQGTLIVRAAVFPLANTSFRSFAKMKKISPAMWCP